MSTSHRFPFARTLIAAAAATSLSALAQQQGTQLDVVTVTAGGYEQSVKDAPASISVITAEEIAKKSYTDVTDVLKNVPGVHIQGGGVEQSVMIRGMSAEYTKFLIDGRPMQDNQAFGLNGSNAGNSVNFLPPLEAIERIEVIRGPASSLYGSDAIGGVVNVITKKVVNKFSGSVSTEYIKSGNDVTNDGMNTNFALNIPLVNDKLSLQLNGGLRHQDEADFVGGDDSAAADPAFKRRNFAAKASLKLDARNTFTLGGGRTEQERTHNPGKSLAIGDDASYNQSLRNNFFATHEGRYTDMLWESYVNYDTSSNPSRVNATTGSGIGFSTLTANSQASFFLGDHTVTSGLNYTDEKLDDGATNGINIPGFRLNTDMVTMARKSAAVFAEDNWQITDDLALLLSGRYDHNDQYGGKFSPKVYAVYDISPTLALKGGYTTGYKSPELRRAVPDFGSTSMGGVIIGSPDLKPETTKNFEIGLNYGNSANGLSGSLTVYQSKFKDKLVRSGRVCAENVACSIYGLDLPAHQFGYTTYHNVDSAQLQGLEWTLDWKVNQRLTYRHSYTYAESEQTSGQHKGSPLNDIPEHMFNASLDWQATAKTNVWTQWNYRGKTSGRAVAASGSATNGVKYPGYSFLDAGVMFQPRKDVKLRFGVYNLLDKKVTPEDGFAYVLDGRRYSVSASFQF